MKPKPLLISLLFLGCLVGGVAYLKPRIALGVAYKAKILCSGVFVSHRDPDSILREDLGAEDLSSLRVFNTHINHSTQLVTASFFGIVTKRARYHPRLGCSLMPDAHITADSYNKPFPSQTTSDGDSAEYVERLPSSLPPNAPRAPKLIRNRLETTLDWAFSESHPTYRRRTRAVVITHHGQIVGERYASGITHSTPLLGWSMTKSVMNALMGLLINQGKLSIEDPAPVNEWQAPGDPRANITLAQLLHMTSGLEFQEGRHSLLNDVNLMLLQTPDMATYAAKKDLIKKVGSTWSYSSGTTLILSGILRKVVGEATYLHFPHQHLFTPLGMDSAILEVDASGTFVGATFMYANARDWAKLGQLFLQDGVWDGHRLLPEGWVDFTTTPVPESPFHQYGAHFWVKIPREWQGGSFSSTIPEDAFHAVGHEGQFISIIPSRQVVVVRLGLTRNPEAWNHVDFLERVLEAIPR